MRTHNLYATSPLSAGICLAAAMHIGPAALAQALPDTITMRVVVRDFVERTEPGGHPDFERAKATNSDGFTVYAVAATIGSDGKPEWAGKGERVKKESDYVQWEDSTGRFICHTLHGAGDGQTGQTTNKSSPFTNKVNFDVWFRDVPGVNLSTIVNLTLVRQADDTYLFDSDLDPFYAAIGGFFPIDDQLYGNSKANDSHNYHFTTEIHASFKYEAGAGQLFKFSGDDDVFVFINGGLVIDLGGTHGSAGWQFVELARLGLTDGDTYSLDIFQAERQTSGSNFAFQTNLVLKNGPMVTISAPFD